VFMTWLAVGIVTW